MDRRLHIGDFVLLRMERLFGGLCNPQPHLVYELRPPARPAKTYTALLRLRLAVLNRVMCPESRPCSRIALVFLGRSNS